MSYVYVSESERTSAQIASTIAALTKMPGSYMVGVYEDGRIMRDIEPGGRVVQTEITYTVVVKQPSFADDVKRLFDKIGTVVAWQCENDKHDNRTVIVPSGVSCKCGQEFPE